MPVNIDGHLNRGMPHLLFDVCEAFAVLDEQACECMAQVMEPYPSHLSVSQQPVKKLPQVAWINLCAHRGLKQPVFHDFVDNRCRITALFRWFLHFSP